MKLDLRSSVFGILEDEVERLQGSHIVYTVDESKLAAAMIELFCSKYLRSEREEIQSLFFDEKANDEKLQNNPVSRYVIKELPSGYVVVLDRKKEMLSSVENI